MNRILSFSTAVVFAMAVLLALVTMPAGAQSVTGSISGTVTDSSGAVVGDAIVVAKKKATNLTVSAKSQETGLFLIPNLPIGEYTVTVSKDGFASEEHSSVVVQANQTMTVSAALKPGSVATTVDVVTSTPLMNQTDTTNGYVLDEKTIQQTPLGTGSFTQLAILSPGVNADFLSGAGTNAGLGNQAIWANGRPDTSNSISVNGITANNIFNGKTNSGVDSTRYTLNTGQRSTAGGGLETNTSVYDAIGQGIPTPAPESIEEIHVNTAMYDASQGGKSGAQIVVVTKSGTNAFHGQAYDYLQSGGWNAAPFFFNANPAIPADQKTPELHRNQFGANVGGPIVKDKLFFFGAYQGVRATDQLGGTSGVSVPTSLTDDRSTTALIAMAQKDFGVSIQPGQLDPAAVKLFQAKVNNQFLIPTPNITDPATVKALGFNVQQSEAAATFKLNQELANFDYVFSEKDRLTVKYLYQDNPATNPYTASSLNGFTQTNNAGAQTASIENNIVLRPNLIWEQKAGFVRMRSFSTTQNPLSPADVGINMFGLSAFPGISISTANTAINKGLTVGTTSNFANTGVFQNQWEYATSLSLVAGRHSIQAGVSWDHSQLNVINLNNQFAKLSFNTVPDLLEGNIRLGSGSVFFNGASNRYYRAEQIGAFVQDNWRFSSHITINLGLRYDFNGPLSEKYGKLTNFHPDAYQYNAATDTITNPGIVFAGNNPDFQSPGVSDSTLTGRQWGVGPRVGVVWNPRGKSITVRSGFGIYYDRGEYFTELSPSAGSGFNGPFGVTLAPPFVTQLGSVAGNTLSNPFGNTAPAPPPQNLSAFATLVPNAAGLKKGATSYLFGGYDPANVLPYTENWTFDLQWQPKNDYLFNIGYTGNHGVHEVIPIPFNQPGIATASNPINGETTSYGFNVVPSETLKTFDGGNTDLRAPYLGFSNSSVFYKAEGISTYNALVVGLRKRLSAGLQLFGSYTWSHALDEQSGLGLFFNGNNPIDPRQSYATSTYDRTHVFSLAYLYQIPGPSLNSRFAKALLKDWTLSGVTIAQSGQPYNVIDFSGAVSGIYYSSFVELLDPVLGLKPGTTISQATLQGTMGVNPSKPVLDPNAFAVPVVTPGTKGVPAGDNFETEFAAGNRNAFRGPFQARFDVSVGKDIAVTERFRMRYQFDAFNVFNHPSFDVPSNNISLYRVSNGVPTAANISSTTLGLIQHTLGSPRFLQMSLRLMF